MPSDNKATGLKHQAAVDPSSLQHPNAFVAADGRTLYRYVVDGEEFIFPKPEEQMTQQDFFNMELRFNDVVSGRLPQNLTVTFKDPQWAGHWFNKKAKDGARVSTARALGFVPAKISDLAAYWGNLNDQDGAVEDFDLVLMKIHKSKLYMTQARWLAKAKKDGGKESYHQRATAGLHPANQETDPYYLAKAAQSEFTGVGPVVPIPSINR